MAKIVLFSSVLLFAYGVQGMSLPAMLNQPNEFLLGTISNISTYAEEELGGHLAHAQEVVDGMEDGVKNTIDKVDSIFTAHLHSVDKAWVKLTTGKESDEEVAKCQALRGYLVISANATLRNVTECLTDKYNEAKDHLNAISNLVLSTLESIHTHVDEANKCLVNVTDWGNKVQSDLCAAKPLGTLIVETTVKVPQVVLQVVELVALITTLPPSLPLCFGGKLAVSLLQDFFRLLKDVKSCIQNLHSAGTAAQTTTADRLLS